MHYLIKISAQMYANCNNKESRLKPIGNYNGLRAHINKICT